MMDSDSMRKVPGANIISHISVRITNVSTDILPFRSAHIIQKFDKRKAPMHAQVTFENWTQSNIFKTAYI